MILIGNDNKKRLSWPIAKIIELIPGRDGEIRTVRLKTQHGTVIRPVLRIFPLEVQAIANGDKELKEESISVKSTKPEKVLNTNDAIVKKYTSGRLVQEPKRLDRLNYNCYSRRATRLLVRLVEGEERWETPDHPQGVLPQNWGGIKPSHTVTCMVLKAAENDKSKSSLLPWMNFVGLDLMLISVTADQPDGHGYELVSSVRALVPQKFSVEEELMHVKHVEVKSPHVGVMWKFGRGVISSGIVLVT
ncbi:DUF5641 domain-containing protein [Trichonephila clavipes]|nr:DUF5641 domain-containing protein [Trichonephila clavipes]